MPRSKDQELEAAFHSWKDEAKKGWTVRCLHCGWTRARHAGRQRQHLEECASTRADHEELNHEKQSIAQQIDRGVQRDMLHRLHMHAARAILMNAHRLSTLEDRDMVEYQRLVFCSKQYRPPTAAELKNDLLPAIWAEDHRDTREYIDGQRYLNLSLDEGPEGEYNIYITTNRGPFYWSTFELPPADPDVRADDNPDASNHRKSKQLFDFLISSLESMMHPRVHWDRFNSLELDLYNPLFSGLKSLIDSDNRIQHVFTLPCYSLLIQRIIDDVTTNIPDLAAALATATEIYNTYPTTSSGLTALHRSCFLGNPQTSLDTPAQRITSSLLNARLALRALIPPSPNDLALALHNDHFWYQIQILNSILTPLTKLQHHLETHPSAHIGVITQSVEALINSTPQIAHKTIRQHLDPLPSPLYTIASLLDPTPADNPSPSSSTPPPPTTFASPSPQDSTLILNFLYPHGPEARSQYATFRLRQGGYSRTWEELDRQPLPFWREMSMFSNRLGALAIRVFSVPATSRLIERRTMEQGMKNCWGRWCNEVGRQKARKWKFVFVNRRVLRGDAEGVWEERKKGWWEEMGMRGFCEELVAQIRNSSGAPADAEKKPIPVTEPVQQEVKHEYQQRESREVEEDEDYDNVSASSTPMRSVPPKSSRLPQPQLVLQTPTSRSESLGSASASASASVMPSAEASAITTPTEGVPMRPGLGRKLTGEGEVMGEKALGMGIRMGVHATPVSIAVTPARGVDANPMEEERRDVKMEDVREGCGEMEGEKGAAVA